MVLHMHGFARWGLCMLCHRNLSLPYRSVQDDSQWVSPKQYKHWKPKNPKHSVSKPVDNRCVYICRVAAALSVFGGQCKASRALAPLLHACSVGPRAAASACSYLQVVASRSASCLSVMVRAMLLLDEFPYCIASQRDMLRHFCTNITRGDPAVLGHRQPRARITAQDPPLPFICLKQNWLSWLPRRSTRATDRRRALAWRLVPRSESTLRLLHN